jgi:hypothetical protein
MMAGFADARDHDIMRYADAADTVPIQQFRVAAPRRLALPVREPGPAAGDPISEFA